MTTAPKCKLCQVRHWAYEPHVFSKETDTPTDEPLPSGTQLVLFDRARLAIEQARTVDEVKVVRDQAQAIRLYFKQARESLEMQNNVAEIKLRAERRIGEMLPTQIGSHDVTLSGMGISKMQSHRWQAEASVPEEEFERHVAEVKVSGKELTSAGLYRLARQTAIPPNGTSQVVPAVKSFNATHPVDSYACHRCGIKTGLDAVVDDETWALISGRSDGGGILCLWCMDEIAAEKGIQNMGARLYFGSGRALFSVPVDEFTDLGWSEPVGDN